MNLTLMSFGGLHIRVMVCTFEYILLTRKSSCVNARGIPTAAYHVLHLLSYPGGGEGVYPIPGQGEVSPSWYPLPILTWLGRGYPIPGLGVPPPWGTPCRDLGPVIGVPPRKDMGPVEVLWDGDGTPLERIWDQWKYYGMEMGYPQPQV